MEFVAEGLSPEFWPLVLVGFAAQLIDGALGMAYGISASAALATMGHPPAFVSATVHAAEVVTTGASGISHAWFRNLDRQVFMKLVLPGMVGGAIGAWLLSELDGSVLKPVVWTYLLFTGVLLLRRAWRRVESELARTPSHALGGIAGFLDAVGGGGWGTVTTPTLIARGMPPRYAIGTANAAEFFVTLTISITFLFTFDWQRYDLVIALLGGGVLAAPIGALIAKHVPPRPAMITVGLFVIVLAINGLVLWWLS
ncbi:MAG: sulfite exporter TauE/SafE family protein [Steroidobacteraceae bacterium]